MNMKVYLAGPMSGYADWNFPAFHAAAAELRRRGMTVASPVELDGEAGHDPNVDGHLGYTHYMCQDLPALLACDGVVVLPGWRESRGARMEVSVARSVDMPVYTYPTMVETIVAADGVTAAGWCMEVDAPAAVPDYPEVAKIGTAKLSTETLHQGKPLTVSPEVVAAMAADLHRPDGRHRVTDAATGGQKDASPERFTYLPYFALMKVLAHYHAGATKYDAHNWRRGYAWSLSIDAAFRHLAKFAAGEDGEWETYTHPVTGEPVRWYCDHLAAVVFHMFALMTFADSFPELDDRFRGAGSLAAAPGGGAAVQDVGEVGEAFGGDVGATT